MSNDLPDGWTMRTLSSLANYQNGRAFKPTEWSLDGLPIIRIAQLTNPNSEPKYYNGRDIKAVHRIDDGDLIFSWSATLLVQIWDRGPAVLNQHLFKVTEAKDVDRHFLAYRLSASIADLARQSHGTTMKHIKKGELDALLVPLPPLPEQRKIAEILSSVDKAIRATEAVIEQTEKVKQAITRSLLGRLASGSGAKLQDYCRIRRGFAFKSTDYIQSGILNFRVSNVGRPLDELGETRFLPENYWEVYKEYRLEGGEIVLVMVGATIGKLGRVPDATGKALLNQNMWVFEPLEGISRRALFYLLQLIVEQVLSHKQGGAYEFFKRSEFAQYELTPLPHEELEHAAERIEAIEEGAGQARLVAKNLAAVKNVIANELLSGRKRTTVA